MEVTGTVERTRCWQTVSFEWKIKDFSKILGRGRYSFVCPEFPLRGHTWYLQLYAEDQSDSIVLTLWSEDPHPAVNPAYSLGIRSASGKTEMEVSGFCAFWGEKGSKSVAIQKIPRPELLRRREEWLPLDVLTVTATLSGYSPSEGTKDVSVQTGVEGNRGRKRQRTDGEDEQGEKAGTEGVQDIGKMWASDNLCDVVFRVREEEFKAHRAILSARIPALAAMFHNDTAEEASGVVNIEDCEPAVFEQLLHYVYKGAPREVTPENAYPLFTVSNKYLVNDVKALCVRFMLDTLRVDTFCNVVSQALMHKEDELLEPAVDFFSKNMLDILQTVQWQTFNRDHSAWAIKILIRAEKIRQKKTPDGDSSRAEGLQNF